MIKDFKEVAHLYLGCEVMIDSELYQTEGVNDKIIDKLIAVTIDGELECDKHSPPSADIKPILRKLESMGYDEFIEAAKIHVASGGTVQITIDDVKAGQVLPTYPEVFAYLLSKHFDLFNLIDNNLAISKE